MSKRQTECPPGGFAMPRGGGRHPASGTGTCSAARRFYPANLGLRRRVEEQAASRRPGPGRGQGGGLTEGLGPEDAAWARRVLGIES